MKKIFIIAGIITGLLIGSASAQQYSRACKWDDKATGCTKVFGTDGNTIKVNGMDLSGGPEQWARYGYYPLVKVFNPQPHKQVSGKIQTFENDVITWTYQYVWKDWETAVKAKTTANKNACDYYIFQPWIDNDSGDVLVLPNTTLNQLGIIATGTGSVDHVVERIDNNGNPRWDKKISFGRAKKIIAKFRSFTDIHQGSMELVNVFCRACDNVDKAVAFGCMDSSECTWAPPVVDNDS